MLDEKDLQAISSLIDTKLDAQEARIREDMQGLESRMNEKVEGVRREMRIIVESYLDPQFKILAEGHAMLQETLAPKDRVDSLEKEVSYLDKQVAIHSREIASLKKAQ